MLHAICGESNAILTGLRKIPSNVMNSGKVTPSTKVILWKDGFLPPTSATNTPT